MDTEEGVEVVWNEATFSEAKKFKAQEDKLRSVFEILTLIIILILSSSTSTGLMMEKLMKRIKTLPSQE